MIRRSSLLAVALSLSPLACTSSHSPIDSGGQADTEAQALWDKLQPRAYPSWTVDNPPYLMTWSDAKAACESIGMRLPYVERRMAIGPAAARADG
jgi:hypothetical protein